MSKEIAQNNTKSLVPAKYYNVFGFRILGLTYEQIAGRTNYHPDHLRHLFAKGGVLYEFWKKWVEETKNENVEEALNMMFGHLPDIVRVLILDAKVGGSPVSVAASKIIFEYTLGKPEQKHWLTAISTPLTFADWIKAETLKEERGAQNANKNDAP